MVDKPDLTLPSKALSSYIRQLEGKYSRYRQRHINTNRLHALQTRQPYGTAREIFVAANMAVCLAHHPVVMRHDSVLRAP